MEKDSHAAKQKRTYQVAGMSCIGCESLLIQNISALEGVHDVQADHISGRVTVTLKKGTSPEAVSRIIEKSGYTVVSTLLEIHAPVVNAPASPTKFGWHWGALILFMFLAYQVIRRLDQTIALPELTSQVSYGILFVIGLLTSLHCVTMCGGIAMSQCLGANQAESPLGRNPSPLGRNPSLQERLRPSLLYNAGRITSYTLLGGVIGAVGSVISMTLRSQGIVIIVAGLFMIFMGLNLLNLFPSLKRVVPHLPRRLSIALSSQRRGKGPYVVGLINGFMPCGPLQTMQLYALGTGSFVIGAASMFFFSLGTAPLMFGLGALSTLVSQRFNKRMLATSGLLVMLLGTVMISRGLSLAGIVSPFQPQANYTNIALIEKDRQVAKIQLEPFHYEPLVVQVGIPVTLIIEAEQANINGCNNAFVIPAYGLQDNILVGENIYEFTPTEIGIVSYSCWMGMIRSSIQVVEDISAFSLSDSQEDPSLDP